MILPDIEAKRKTRGKSIQAKYGTQRAPRHVRSSRLKYIRTDISTGVTSKMKTKKNIHNPSIGYSVTLK